MTTINRDELADGYRIADATCPTCGHEHEVAFSEGFSCSTMLGWYDGFKCPECDEYFTLINLENGIWLTYWEDGEERWMYAAGFRQWNEKPLGKRA